MLPCWSCGKILSLTAVKLHILCFNFRCWRRERVSYVACLEWRWWVIWKISKEELSLSTPVKWFGSCLKCLLVLFMAKKEFATSGITRVHYSKERDSKKKCRQMTWKAHLCARQSSGVWMCKAAREHQLVERWMCEHKPLMCLGVVFQ